MGENSIEDIEFINDKFKQFMDDKLDKGTFANWVLEWKDLEFVVDTYNHWDTDTKKEVLIEFKDILTSRGGYDVEYLNALTDKDVIEESFRNLTENLMTDKEWELWVESWLDLDFEYKIALDWDIETKKDYL